MDGWHGTSTRSAARAASRAAASLWGAVSMSSTPVPISRARDVTLARRAGCTLSTCGMGFSRASCHSVAEACGSRSTTSTSLPASQNAADRCSAKVVFPAPPFWLTSAMVRMLAPSHGAM